MAGYIGGGKHRLEAAGGMGGTLACPPLAFILIKGIAINVAAAMMFAFGTLAFAAVRNQTGEKASLSVIYNDAAAPGDAIVLRLAVKTSDGKKTIAISSAAAELFGGKRIEKTVFFLIPAKGREAEEHIAFIPLSTWLKEGGYTVRVSVTVLEEEITAELPFTVTHKDFISETIMLDERNTSIKTDTSQARMNQIKRLNAILASVNPSDIFTLEPFLPPVAANTRRSSHFGDRRVYKYSSGKSSTAEHFGIDYAVPTGTEVSAAAAGLVVMAEDRVSTGWSAAIEHAPGLYSLYYHLSALSVKTGQKVQAGEKLGLSGATGLATGPHLHWEVRLNMCAVSPDFWTGDYAMLHASANGK